ncbi:hypothetical protein ACM55H_17645 [Flavobacterium sp. ZT3R17]|uniref:hypothetical protein n=1 Tax=Flavobacterium cryoconiti TaxID=3398736 RepID=UPI003A89A25E
MQELLDIQKKYSIKDKDLYVLSKLSADLKTSSLFEKEKVNAKIKSVLTKYNVGMLDKIKTIKALTKSDYHNSPELIEKYKDSEKSEELNIAGKKGKQNFIIIACVFVVIFLAVSLNNSKKSDNNSSYENSNSTTQNPCSDMESYNQGVKEGRLQRGVLTDCETAYPYEGWADNKECWCEGFKKGKNE